MTKEELLQDLKLKQEEVTTPSGVVTVRELAGLEYADTFNSPFAKDEKGEFSGVRFTALLVTRCVRDEKGDRVFSDEDSATLPETSGRVYNALCAAVNRVNGLSGDEGNA